MTWLGRCAARWVGGYTLGLAWAVGLVCGIGMAALAVRGREANLTALLTAAGWVPVIALFAVLPLNLLFSFLDRVEALRFRMLVRRELR